MPTRDGYQEGIPAWVDLATTDVDAAKHFYAGLFGWEYQDPEDRSIPYWMAMRHGRMAAGIGPTQEGVSFSVWSTYFAVDDADATVEKIRNAGGQVVAAPMDILDSGRMAIAADPTGAVFGVWQSREHKGAGIVNEHGSLNWNELTSDDLDTALRFYKAVFGHETETSPGVSGPYTVLSVGGRGVAGAMQPPTEDIPNNWGVYFAVDDATEALDATLASGGRHVYGPMEKEDVGIFVGIVDPTGAMSTLIQLAHEMD